MTAEEVFSKLAAHMIEGVMFHSQMADYYTFLGLDGYAKCHCYHSASEMAELGRLKAYYITHFDKLLPEVKAKNPDAIPSGWLRYERNDVDVNTRRSAVKSGAERWVLWETETKALYEQMYRELEATGEIAAALEVTRLIRDVSDELCTAKQKHLLLKSTDYSADYTADEQRRCLEHYSAMLETIY